jgi:hypothetical protein
MGAETRIVRFLLTGDAKGALKAQEETEKGFEKTGKSADESGKHIGLLSKAFSGMRNVIGYGSGILGLAGVAYGLKDVVQAGTQWQAQQVQLRNALKNTGEQGAGHLNKINQAIERSSTHGGSSPIEEARGITQLIQVTGSATTALQTNAAAVNLARGAHLEYSAALKIVARAQTGTAARSQQYLGIIQPIKTYVDQLTEAQKRQNPELLRHAELLDKQATAQEINRRIMQRYAGATQAYSKTAAGAINNFRNILDLLMERIGKALLPLVTRVSQALAGAAQWIIYHWSQISGVFKHVFAVMKIAMLSIPLIAFIKLFEKNRQVAIALAAGIAAVAVPIGVYVGAMALATLATTAWGVAMASAATALFVLTSPVSLIVIGIAALVAGVVYAYMHFKTFRDVVNTVFSTVKSIVLGAVQFIGEHWQALLATFALPLLPVAEIIKHFGAVKKGVESVFSGIGKFVSGVFGGIVGFVTKGINLVIKAINLLIEGYNVLPWHKHVNPLGEIGGHSTQVTTHSKHSVIPLPARGELVAQPIHMHHKIMLDSRVLSEGTTLYTLKRAARK